MYLNKSQGVLFGSANQTAQKQTLYHKNIAGSQNGMYAGKNNSAGGNSAGVKVANNAGGTGGSGIHTVGGDLRAIKRMLTQSGQKNQNSLPGSNIVDQSMSYADSLRASRAKAENTSLQLKKLKYNFKSLSTKILRSKTSTSAKQVASEARREVLKLKRQLKSGEYDDEELQSAITHAQAMERVAKKKAAHLLEEEMVKVTGGPCAAETEEREDQKDASKEEALEDALAEFEGGGNASDPEWDMTQERTAALQEQMQAYQEMAQLQMEQLQEEMAARMEEMQWAMEEMTQRLQEEAAASSEDMMSELMDEMSESMKELLENSGLEDLAESMFATTEVEVDPADYKMMKIKHRSEEMKALAKADAEYLKDLFDRLEKMKGSGVQSPMSGGHSAGGFSGMPSGGIVVSAGGGDAIKVTPMPDSQTSHMPDMDPVSLPGGSGAPGADGAVSMSGSVDIFL